MTNRCDDDEDITVYSGGLDLSRPAKDVLMELEEILANADSDTDSYIVLNVQNVKGGVSTLIITLLDGDDEIPEAQVH